LVVELDGGQHSEETDAARTRFLEAEGYRVIRFWNNEVLGNLDGVLERIASVADPSSRLR
jgi:very-short-patch-repair endonuclease